MDEPNCTAHPSDVDEKVRRSARILQGLVRVTLRVRYPGQCQIPRDFVFGGRRTEASGIFRVRHGLAVDVAKKGEAITPPTNMLLSHVYEVSQRPRACGLGRHLLVERHGVFPILSPEFLGLAEEDLFDTMGPTGR